MAVPVNKFGRDHWSTLAYIEIRCVDHKGIIKYVHMRCDANRHPGLAHLPATSETYPTILKGGEELLNHDDWDCVDDLVSAGFVIQEGTGIQPILKMTSDGREVTHKLREHKENGGSFGNFDVTLK